MSKSKKPLSVSRQGPAVPAAPPPPPTAAAIPYWQPILLAVIAFCVYGNALNAGFVWDDDRQVLQNPYLRDAGSLPKIFTTNVWAFKGAIYQSNYYRPVMHLTYRATYQTVGPKPGGFHAVNNFFHLLNSLQVYGLVFLLFRHAWAAFFSGLLFATHPIHTEAVVWVASLPEVTVTFFYLLALILYILPYAWNRPVAFYRAFSLIAFFMALLSKEMALTLPLILAAYEIIYRRSSLGRTALSVSPFAVPLIIYMLMRTQALGGVAAVDAHPEVEGLSLIWSIFVLLAKYGWKLLAPWPLNFFHVFEANLSPIEPTVLGSLVVVLAWIVGAWRLRATHPGLALGLFWILLTLLPALGIKQVGENVFTERYLYLPSVAFCWIVVYGLMVWADRVGLAESRKPPITLVAVVILSGLYALSTWTRSADYKDEETLLTKTVTQSPAAAPMRNGLGMVYFRLRQYDRAEAEFKEALRYKPGLPEARMNLGVIFFTRGQMGAAVKEYQEALRQRPNYAEAHYNMGLALMKGQALPAAINAFQQAVQWNPEYAKAHSSLGAALRADGRPDLAVAAHQKALALKPDLVEAHINLGLDYLALGQAAPAAEAFDRALRIDPNYAEGYHLLGIAYAQQGRWQEAIRQYQEALRLKPNLTEARTDLERAIARQNP